MTTESQADPHLSQGSLLVVSTIQMTPNANHITTLNSDYAKIVTTKPHQGYDYCISTEDYDYRQQNLPVISTLKRSYVYTGYGIALRLGHV